MGQIQIENLKKTFGTVEVLKGIDLEIEEGELAVFVGPSGCGKSTLLRQISGLDQPSSGKILIDGKDVTHLSAANRGLAMVFQSYALYPHMTVEQNLSFGLQNQKMAKADIQKRVSEAATMLEIGPLMDRKPGQLSGGQRQRVAIGRAIVRDPTAFLLDEPLSNLDAELRVTMRAELAALHGRLKSTMIYVTHDQIEAMTLADRIVVLRDGEIEQIAAPIDIFNTPANKFVAGFMGAPSMNFFGKDDAVNFIDPANIPSDAVTIGVRPQHLERADAGLNMTITLVEALGTETVLHGELASKANIIVTSPGHLDARAGDVLTLSADEAFLHFFDANDQRIDVA